MQIEDLKAQSYYQDWTKVLTSRLSQSQTWTDLFEALSLTFAENIYSQIYALTRVRDPEIQSRDINIHSAKFLGLEYRSGLFTDNEYVALVKFLNQFNRKHKGTKDFISFLGWIKKARFTMYQLWADGDKNSSDYGSFFRYNDMIGKNSIFNETGTHRYFPTTHVELQYNAEEFDIDEADIPDLFYKIAPAHLVLTNIEGAFFADDAFLTMHTGLNTYSSGRSVIPCYYQQTVKFNLLPCNPFAWYKSFSQFDGYSYVKDGTLITTQLPTLTTRSDDQDFYNNFEIDRNSDATYYPKNSNYRIEVGVNTPRLEYVKNSVQGLGLHIERESTNLLLDALNPVVRTVKLQPGDYVFSCNGLFDIYFDDLFVKEIDSESFSFTAEQIMRVKFVPISCPPDEQNWFQLENGKVATSLIASGPLATKKRENENVKLVKFPDPYKECTISMSFNHVADNSCLLKAYSTQYSYTTIYRRGDKLELLSKVNPRILVQKFINYEENLIFGLKNNQVHINFNRVDIPGADIPLPRVFYIGSDDGKDIIDGYITDFRYFPVYV